VHPRRSVPDFKQQPDNQFEFLLDTVRNRLLTFMLELEEQFPDLVESETLAKDIPKEQAANIFHT